MEERLPFFGATLPLPEAYERYRGRLMQWHKTLYDALPSEYRNMGLSLLWDLSGSIQGAMTCNVKGCLEKLLRYNTGVTSLMPILPQEIKSRASSLYDSLESEMLDVIIEELGTRCGCKVKEE